MLWGCFHESESCSVVSNGLGPHGLYSPWNSPGQNTGVGSLSLLQGIFPTQGSNPGLPHCRWILYQLSHKGSPRILEWVVYPFSRGSSRHRNRTEVSCIVGGFFTNWGMMFPWFLKNKFLIKKKATLSLLKSYYDPFFSLYPATIKGCLRTDQKNEDTTMLALLRTWLKDCCSQKWLFCIDLCWIRQRERVATYSRKWQRLVELNECSYEKALLWKRVTILLPWSTNYKMSK